MSSVNGWGWKQRRGAIVVTQLPYHVAEIRERQGKAVPIAACTSNRDALFEEPAGLAPFTLITRDDRQIVENGGLALQIAVLAGERQGFPVQHASNHIVGLFVGHVRQVGQRSGVVHHVARLACDIHALLKVSAGTAGIALSQFRRGKEYEQAWQTAHVPEHATKH